MSGVTTGWIRWTLRPARRHRAALSAMAGLVVLRSLIVLAMPWPTALAVDHLLTGRPLPGWVDGLAGAVGATSPLAQLTWIGVALAALAAAHAGIKVALATWQRSLGRSMAYELGAEALELVQRQSVLGAATTSHGELVQRVITDTRCAELLVMGVLMTGFGSIVTLALLGGVVLALSGVVASVGVGVGLAMALVARRFNRRLQSNAIDLAATEGSVTSATEQMLAALPEIQTFAAERVELERFAAEADRRLAATVVAQWTSLKFRVGVAAATAVGTASVMGVTGLAVVRGSGTVGELLVVLAYFGSLFGPIEELVHLAQATATARAGSLRLSGLDRLVQPVPEPADPVAYRPTGDGATISFRGVSFGFDPDRPVLAGVDLDISAGETVAVVGPSGTGKSTLLGLVPRFFDPWSGVVEVGGVDVSTVSTAALRGGIALARQDPLLLPLTVRDNIVYGCAEVDDARVRRAADASLVTEFAGELPDGLDTVLAEGGRSLSGGQRQRLAIARALYRPSRVLLLDEPTSGLDAETEAELMRRLVAAAAGRTIVFVTHRLSTVRIADRIVVLDGTGVSEQGDHESLLARDGLYARYSRLHSFEPGTVVSADGDAGAG